MARIERRTACTDLALHYVRRDSHQKITEKSARQHARTFPPVDRDDLRIATRPCTEAVYAATEVAADRVVRYFEKFCPTPA